jgi:hypothetical protein
MCVGGRFYTRCTEKSDSLASLLKLMTAFIAIIIPALLWPTYDVLLIHLIEDQYSMSIQHWGRNDKEKKCDVFMNPGG